MPSSTPSTSFVLVFVGLALVVAASASPAVARLSRRLRRGWPDARSRRREEIAFDVICRTMHDALLTFDTEGTIRWANAAAERMFATPSGGLAGSSLLTILPTFDISARHLGACELPIRTASGDERIVELVVSDVHGADRASDGASSTVVLRDVTQRVLDERRLRRQLQESWDTQGASQAEAERLTAARDSAEQATRAMGEFLTTMSHELQAPMCGVLGMAQQLLHSTLSEEQARRVEGLKRSGESLLRIIDDVLDFSSIEAGRLRIDWQPFDLLLLLDEVRETVAPAAEIVGLSVDLEVDAQCPRWVLGDGGRIRQILLNLLWNAIKFTDRGSVTICARRRPGTDGPAIDLHVIDTGVGMPAPFVEALFSPFSAAGGTGGRRHGSAGLGLVISKRLADMMDGTLSVASALGVGTQFTLTLPLPATTPPVPIAVAASALDLRTLREPATASHGVYVPHVLMADDNLISQMVTVSLLAHLGCTVDVATDGREAVRRWSEGTYDLILMDCHMPHMDGFDATRAIRAAEREAERGAAMTPIVALTVNATDDDIARCHAAGMAEHLPKPVTERALADLLQRLKPGISDEEPARGTQGAGPATKSPFVAPDAPAPMPVPVDCAR